MWWGEDRPIQSITEVACAGERMKNKTVFVRNGISSSCLHKRREERGKREIWDIPYFRDRLPSWNPPSLHHQQQQNSLFWLTPRWAHRVHYISLFDLKVSVLQRLDLNFVLSKNKTMTLTNNPSPEYLPLSNKQQQKKKPFKRLASKTELPRGINRENTEELKRNKQIPVYYNVVLNMIVDTILTHSAPRGIHNSVLPMSKGVTGQTKMFLMVQTNTKTIFS